MINISELGNELISNPAQDFSGKFLKEDKIVIQDTSPIELSFTIMPGRPVGETFHIKEYYISGETVYAKFDRAYLSAMDKSPSHVIFITAMLQSQKMLYFYATHKLGYSTDPKEREKVKLWPHKVDVNLPTLIRDENDLVQSLKILEFTRLGAKSYSAKTRIEVNGNKMVFICDWYIKDIT